MPHSLQPLAGNGESSTLKLRPATVSRIAAVGAVVAMAVAATHLSAQAAAKNLKANPVAVAHSIDGANELVEDYCAGCHNDDIHRGGLSLKTLDLAHPDKNPVVAEKVIRKLRAGMMPPPKAPRPPEAELAGFTSGIENRLDRVALAHPYAGFTALHRLNRVEYANSIKALLDLDIDAASLLPPDDLSHGFNNMADVLTVSPALFEAYISAAGKISRLAVGDPTASAQMATYIVPRVISQTSQVDGAPLGTRGGISMIHNFPADGEYVFKVAFYTHQQGYLFGQNQGKGQQLEISVNGTRVALIDVDVKYKDTDDLRTPPIKIAAGPQRISAAFVKKFDGPIQDEVQPYEQSLIDVNVANLPGLTTLPHLRSLGILGPSKVTGVSPTPSRERIFVAYPSAPTQETAAARKIVASLVRRAYRKPAKAADVDGALKYYTQQRQAGASFDEGIRASLQAILSNPQFLFRFEQQPPRAAPGTSYRVSDIELASRLSYFLWSAPPDEQLLRVAVAGQLHDRAVLAREVRRMLKDKHSDPLETNFAVEWLSLKNLNDVLPDVYLFPNFDQNLAQSMLRETELFFGSIVHEDRSVLDLLGANYTFVDERLARHYGIANVSGSRFRRITITDENRKGLLGQASILTLTSTANRTAPVTRGKWVMQVLFGSAPPPPPPNVPALTEAGDDASVRTVRARMEQHRKNPNCAGCHRFLDPIGFSLENYDPTGAWRSSDNGEKIDATGVLFDGTPLDSPASLRRAVLKRPEAFLRALTENLYAYGLGRIPETEDLPEIRAIVAGASANNYRFSDLVLGIVTSPAFQRRTVPAVNVQPDTHGKPRKDSVLKASGSSQQHGVEAFLAARPIEVERSSSDASEQVRTAQ
ncbi:DUF1592 domain-containing protein [Acidicapsa ligni]|uniref:DUF1592 domain-containing protein n=1 Tax=Acidicapsa ligni TaxID=542300 RepID=UPI0021E07DA4|nr:DUF1592 domain-containing protein [Acidicapsa ligni]